MLAAAAICGVAGVVVNDAAGNPSKLSKHAVLIYGGSALVLWALAIVLLILGIARFNRVRRASEQERAQATVRRLTDAHLTQARELAGQLLTGEAPALGQVWDVVLEPDERVLLEGSLVYSRYYGLGSAPTYTHVSTGHYGNVGVGRVALDHAIDGAGNRRRSEEAAFAAAARWRERQQSRAVVTDRQVLCQVQGKGWLSFEHAVTTAIQPVPETQSVVLEYPGTSPLCLSGPLIAEITVILVWALYGANGLREHPALADVRSLAPFPELIDGGLSVPPDSEAGAEECPSSDTTVEDVLALITTRELLLAEHVTEQLAIGEEEAAAALEQLVEAGLVSRVRFSSDSPVAYLATERGAAQADARPAPLVPLDIAGDEVAAAIPGR